MIDTLFCIRNKLWRQYSTVLPVAPIPIKGCFIVLLNSVRIIMIKHTKKYWFNTQNLKVIWNNPQNLPCIDTLIVSMSAYLSLEFHVY